MTRTISIGSTPLLKSVLGPIWLVGAAYAIWVLWARPESVLDDYQPGGMTALQLILLALLAASLVVLFAFVVPLKRVRLAPDGLLVSNYLRESVVPFSAIASVRQYSLPTSDLSPCGCGTRLRSAAAWCFCQRFRCGRRSGGRITGTRMRWSGSCGRWPDHDGHQPSVRCVKTNPPIRE